MLPAIGSLTALNAGGRLGIMVDVRPPAEPADAHHLAALQLRTVDQRDAQGQVATRVSGLAPLPAEATERPGSSRRILATRDDAGAHFGYRLYAETQSNQAQSAELQSGLRDDDPVRTRTRGGRVDLTS